MSPLAELQGRLPGELGPLAPRRQLRWLLPLPPVVCLRPRGPLFRQFLALAVPWSLALVVGLPCLRTYIHLHLCLMLRGQCLKT